MDEEIRAYLKREQEETNAFFEAWNKNKPELCLEPKAHLMFSAGMEKYGLKWSKREYKLRNEKQLT